MSNALQSWLERIPEFQGLLGAYVVPPQQPPEARSCSEDCSTERIQFLHRQVQDVVDVLDAGHMPARKLRWIFERTVVYFERKADGTGLCLITTHEPWVGENEAIANLIGEFRDLR